MKQATENNSKKKTVLITGASGLIGQLIYQHLIQFPKQYSVYATDFHEDLSARFLMEKKRGHAKPKFKTGYFIQADLTNKQDIRKIFTVAQFDVVIHLAAVLENSSVDLIEKVNVQGAKNLLDACLKHNVKRVVFASTIMTMSGYFDDQPYRLCTTYESNRMPPDVELITVDHLPKPYSRNEKGRVYTESKLTIEKMARDLSEQSSMQCFAARFFWVNVDDKPHGRWMDQFRCSHEDTVAFLQCCVDATLEKKYITFFVGSIYDDVSIFDFKEGKLIDFIPSHYGTDSINRPSV